MLLESKGVSLSLQEETITIDGYIPLNVKFEENWKRGINILYWRAEKEGSFLFEFGISELNGSVARFVLVCFAQKTIEFIQTPNFLPHPEPGIPFFQTCDIFDKNGYCDNQIDLKVMIGPREIYIFFDSAPPITCFKNGQILFGLTKDGHLNMIGVVQIEESMYKTMLHALTE